MKPKRLYKILFVFLIGFPCICKLYFFLKKNVIYNAICSIKKKSQLDVMATVKLFT